MWQQLLRDTFRAAGVDVRRVKNVPTMTFLGLRGVAIDLVLDVGANRGQFAQYARSLFPGAQLHCFEPLPQPGGEIRRWAAATSDQRVHVHEMALGEQQGTATLLEHVDHSPSSSFLKNSERHERLFPQTVRTQQREVRVETLDGWVAATGVAPGEGTLLKLDVQGFEAQVLRGARQTLPRIAMCMVEVTPVPLYDEQTTFLEIVTLLGAGGLHYFGNIEQIHDESGMPVYLDALFVRPGLVRG